MPEYIEREATDKALCELIRDYDRTGCSLESSGASMALYWFRCRPAADVRPVVRGEWRYVSAANHTQTGAWECSQCSDRQTHKSDFCPNCGADMREEAST